MEHLLVRELYKRPRHEFQINWCGGRRQLTVDKECSVGGPYAHRNCHGNSVPIPDGDSTKS